MNENINFEKKILLNLDGYQINVFLEPLKKFLRKYHINIALHCASLEDKKVLENNFSSNINIYCFEDYVRKNYKNTKLDQFEFVSRQLQLSIEEIDLAFEFYKKYYFHGIISKLKKKEISKKRAILYYNFYDHIFKKFNPDIVLHEHSGGTGSKILWNFCKKNNRDYYFIKGLYFKDKFIILDHRNFSSPFFNLKNTKNYPDTEIDKFKKNYLNQINLAPFEINAKKINKIKIFNKFKNLFNKAKIYYRNKSEINYLLNRFPPFFDAILYNFLSKFRKFIFTNFISENVSLNEKYVAVYLQVEPELTVYSLQHKVNIQKFLEILSIALPNNYFIYLKEHPSQHINSRFRSLSFFRKLKGIRNLKICKLDLNSKDLIKNSEFLISGGGTAAFESILYNKPCINYGQNFYLNYKTLLNFKEENEISQVVNKILNDEKYKNIFKVSEKENINFALNVKNSMLDGYLFLSNEIQNLKIREKNNDDLYESLKKIFVKITNKS